MRKNKLMISAITLAFAVVAVVSTTFAWFTMNTTNTVDNLDFEATAGSGLYMSLDGTNYYTKLTKDHFKAFEVAKTGDDSTQTVIKGFDNNFQLKPVTLLDTVSDGTHTYSFVDQKSQATTDGYVTFKLYFKSSTAVSIYVSDLTAKSGEATMKVIDVDSTFAKELGLKGDVNDATITTDLVNAVKVRLVSANAKGEEVLSKHIKVSGAVADLGDVNTNSDTNVGLQYLKHVSPDDHTNLFTDFKTTLSSVYSSYSDLDKSEALLTLTQASGATEYTGSVNVTVWVDGFDEDCFDALLQKTLTFGLQFSTTQPSA